MCVIAICKTRGMKESEIRGAFAANTHGAGYGWSDGQRIHYRKGFMNVDKLIESYKDSKMKRKLPHVVHFRNATSTICKELTHPYIISDDSPNVLEYDGDKSILFHNGVLSAWRATMLDFFMFRANMTVPSGLFSDTRFIAIVMSQLGYNSLELLNAGKFVVLTLDDIKALGDFTNDKGVLFSNLSYRGAYEDRGGRRILTHGTTGSGPLSVRYNTYDNEDLTDLMDLTDFDEESLEDSDSGD